jgi:hypothetical protein
VISLQWFSWTIFRTSAWSKMREWNFLELSSCTDFECSYWSDSPPWNFDWRDSTPWDFDLLLEGLYWSNIFICSWTYLPSRHLLIFSSPFTAEVLISCSTYTLPWL